MTNDSDRKAAEENSTCQYCGQLGATRYRQNTKYIDEALNWKTLCDKCREENDEYWAEMWSAYYSDCF